MGQHPGRATNREQAQRPHSGREHHGTIGIVPPSGVRTCVRRAPADCVPSDVGRGPNLAAQLAASSAREGVRIMTLQYTPLMDGRLIWDDGSAMHVVYAVETPEEALPLMLTRCAR